MTTDDEMVGWHHQLNGYKFEQTLGDSEGQESLTCCSPQDCKESHDGVTEQQQQDTGRQVTGVTAVSGGRCMLIKSKESM